MKIMYLLGLFFITNLSLAQTPMTLYLNDGTTVSGPAERQKQKIKIGSKDQNSKYELKTIDSILVGDKGTSKMFHVMHSWGKIYNMYELYSRGKKMNVYVSETSTSSGYGVYHFTNYYVKRHNESQIASFGNGNMWDSFKKKAAKYFKDCPELALKIKKGEKGFAKKDLRDIATYYNSKCN